MISFVCVGVMISRLRKDEVSQMKCEEGQSERTMLVEKAFMAWHIVYNQAIVCIFAVILHMNIGFFHFTVSIPLPPL